MEVFKRDLGDQFVGDFKRHFRESCLLDISSITLGGAVYGKVKADFREKNLSWISSSSKNNL